MRSKKILIIRLSSIGDIILSYPLIWSLKNGLSPISLHYLVKKRYENVLSPVSDYLKTIYTISDSAYEIRKTRQWIQENNFDLIIDIQNNLRSLLYSSGQKTVRTKLQKHRIRRFLFIKFKWDIYPKIHVHEKYLIAGQVAENQRILTPSQPLSNQATDIDIDRRITKFALKNPIIIIYPGARHFTKRWPMKNVKQLIEFIITQTKWQIILAGDKEDTKLLKKHSISRYSDKRILNVTGEYTIPENFALIKNVDLVMSNDSAPMHIAALMNKPQIALFGNTTDRFGFFPLNNHAVILETNNLDCRPCSHIGYDRCPRGHFKCMEKIGVEDVYKTMSTIVTRRAY